MVGLCVAQVAAFISFADSHRIKISIPKGRQCPIQRKKLKQDKNAHTTVSTRTINTDLEAQETDRH